jgi:nucleoside-diphosphate-sugar epimerase
MMKVLVLGGSQFIGRTVVDRLLQGGHTVSILNRGSRKVAGVEQLVADRGDAHGLNQALAGRTFDGVIDYELLHGEAGASGVRGHRRAVPFLAVPQYRRRLSGRNDGTGV